MTPLILYFSRRGLYVAPAAASASSLSLTDRLCTLPVAPIGSSAHTRIRFGLL